MHLATYLAAVIGCAPASTPHKEAPPRPKPEAIVVDDDPKYDSCRFQQPVVAQLNPFRDDSLGLASTMAQIHLVRTTEAAVGTTTVFDVLHTFHGPPAATLAWQHGGRLHPINAMIEPDRPFVLFERTPFERSAARPCDVPEGLFIRDIDGPSGRSYEPCGDSPLCWVSSTAPASNREIARALAASLPVKGAALVGVDIPFSRPQSSVGVHEMTFVFVPPRTTEEMMKSALLPRHPRSIFIETALRIDGADVRVLVSGRHSTPIGAVEELYQPPLDPPETRRFQVLVQESERDVEVVLAWLEPSGDGVDPAIAPEP